MSYCFSHSPPNLTPIPSYSMFYPISHRISLLCHLPFPYFSSIPSRFSSQTYSHSFWALFSLHPILLQFILMPVSPIALPHPNPTIPLTPFISSTIRSHLPALPYPNPIQTHLTSLSSLYSILCTSFIQTYSITYPNVPPILSHISSHHRS